MNSITYKTIMSSFLLSLTSFFKFTRGVYSVALPVLARELSTQQLLVLTVLRTLGKALLFPFMGLYALTYYIPSLCGALYFKQHSFWFNLTLPLICMALFMMHPVGGAAWVYAMFWVIPVTITLLGIDKQTVFAAALGSTFVTHAVGSVLFLYCLPTVATYWLALVPVVVFERLLYATGISMVYGLVYSTKVVFSRA